MASATSDAGVDYLPPLEDILTLGHHLLSWQKAYAALLRLDLNSPIPQPLQGFFDSESSITNLKNDTFVSQPSAQSRDDFDTRTAAIHVTPGASAEYNIAELKDDALWISAELKIDEASALRVVLLEWQQRAQKRLLDGYTEEELISLQSVLGSWHDRLRLNIHYGGGRDEASLKTFRRSQLVRLALDEQLALLNTRLWLETFVIDREGNGAHALDRSQKTQTGSAWLDKIIDRLGLSSGRTDVKPDTLISRIQNLHTLLSAIDDGVPWNLAQLDEDLGGYWVACQCSKVVFTLRVVYLHVGLSLDQIPREALRSWFEFVDRLESVSMDVTEKFPHIETLVAAISVQILKFQSALDLLTSGNAVQSTDQDYFLDFECATAICLTMYNAAMRPTVILSPAMLAWALIMQSMRASLPSSPRLSISEEDSSPLSRRLSTNFESRALTGVSGVIQAIFEDAEKFDMTVPDFVTFISRTSLDTMSVFAVIGQLAAQLPAALDYGTVTSPELRCRTTLLDLIDATCILLNHNGYNEATLGSTIEVLTTDDTRFAHPQSDDIKPRLVEHFFRSDNLANFFLGQALQRYPYELRPFLQLAKALSVDDNGTSALASLLEDTPTFTLQFPQHFDEYKLIHEDEFSNRIALTTDLPLIVTSRNPSSLFNTTMPSLALVKKAGQSMQIVCGTEGTLITDTRPFICMVDYRHSALSYLGAALSAVPAASTRFNCVDTNLSKSAQADIISLLTTRVNRDSNATEPLKALEMASDRLDDDEDIVNVIFDIFEEELLATGQQRDDGSKQVLVECVQFFTAMTHSVPNRLWPFLARSSLLEFDGHGGKLQSVVASFEITSGNYDFLLACARLYEGLLRDASCIGSTVNTTQRAQDNRYAQNKQTSSVPSKVVSRILLSFSRILCDVSSTAPEWGFTNIKQKLQLNTIIWTSFQRLMYCTYGLQSSASIKDSAFVVLEASAKYVAHNYLASRSVVPTLRSLILPLAEDKQAYLMLENNKIIDLRADQKRAALGLLQEIANLGSIWTQEFVHLRQTLFDALPVFVRLYALTDELQSIILRFLRTIVDTACIGEGDPPSLLGCLGQGVGEDFLNILRQSPLSLFDDTLATATWDFMAAAVSKKQRWLSTFLLTGMSPRSSAVKDGGGIKSAKKGEAVLDLALSSVPRSLASPQNHTLATLNFILQAQTYWPWVSLKISAHGAFLESAIAALGKVEPVPASKSTGKEAIEFAKMYQCNAFLAELFGLLSHNLRLQGDFRFTQKLLPVLGLPGQVGLFAPNYNSSLHANLSRNFEAKYPRFKLGDFRRAQLSPCFGNDYLYDVMVMKQAIGAEKSSTARGHAFLEEVQKANENLSLVEAQIHAFDGWRILATELSLTSSRPDSANLQRSLSYMILDCIELATSKHESAVVLERLAHSRAELAETLLQQLIMSSARVAPTTDLVTPAFFALRNSCDNFDIFLTGASAAHQRTLLRTLYLTLQAQESSRDRANGAKKANEAVDKAAAPKQLLAEGALLVNICTEVVAKGFRTLTAQLHDNDGGVQVKDFEILVAILNHILSTPENEFAHGQIAVALANSGISRVALSLFSWCERVSSTGKEGWGLAFARVCVSMLQSLSTIPTLAQFLAAEGILAQLDGSSIMRYLRRAGGSGALDEEETGRRMHGLWSRNILPLVLNLVVAVGDSYAAEAASFLNGFEEQLKRAGEGLEAKDGAPGITLDTACEEHMLALVSVALREARERPGAAAGMEIEELKWDAAGVKEDAEGWVSGSVAALQERIVAISERESRLLASGRLAELVLAELKGVLACSET